MPTTTQVGSLSSTTIKSGTFKLVSVLEALASDVVPTGPNMSNRSTPPAADADDQ